MIRNKFLLLLGLLIAPTFAQSDETFSKWLPNNWKIIDSEKGDLNRDGIDDAILVIEEKNLNNFKANSGSGPSILNLNPRRLIVLLGSQNGFKELIRRDALLPSEHVEDMGCLGDPLANGGIAIERGNLTINLQDWRSCGSYGVVDEKFTFRLHGTRFQLIGYDRSESSRSTGERSEYSTNYLTGKIKISTGLNDFSNVKAKVTWKKRQSSRAFFLDDITLQCDTADPAEKNNWCQ